MTCTATLGIERETPGWNSELPSPEACADILFAEHYDVARKHCLLKITAFLFSKPQIVRAEQMNEEIAKTCHNDKNGSLGSNEEESLLTGKVLKKKEFKMRVDNIQ